MGKTPKSKNVNYRSKSHLQPKVAQHRPNSNGAEKLSFPGKSDQCAPAKRRMKLTGSLSRKSSQEKGFSIKVNRPSSSADAKELERVQIMSVVTAEVSEAISVDPQPIIIFENGKEDSQEKEEEKDSKDLPSMSNGSQSELTKALKSDVDDITEITTKQIQDGNSVQDTVIGEGNPSLKLSKDEEGDPKKQRPGTPQSRSSTPQRKSDRVRSKQGSPSKNTPAINVTPALKILKINLTHCKSTTNGALSTEKSTKVTNEDSVKSKKKDIEMQEKVDHGMQVEKEANDVQVICKETDEPVAMEKDVPKLQPEGNAPYLSSLRLISGRRSLSTRSPYSFSSNYSSESSTSFTMQWKKKQSRKKDGSYLKDDSESEYQDTENEFHASTISGKRKAERGDDHASLLAVSSLKKPKSEDDELRLYLHDGEEDISSIEKDLIESEFVDDQQKENTLKQSSSADYDDEMEELKDVPEKSDKQETFINDESMEFGYEAREGYVKSQDSPTASNQSSNKRWCILM